MVNYKRNYQGSKDVISGRIRTEYMVGNKMKSDPLELREIWCLTHTVIPYSADRLFLTNVGGAKKKAKSANYLTEMSKESVESFADKVSVEK